MGQQGFYPDPPSRRMAYDSDGSVLAKEVSGVVYQLGTELAYDYNGEAYVQTDGGGRFGEGGWKIIIFPELRNITHSYRNLTGGTYAVGSHGNAWYVSSNTTNGQDGDWVVSNSYTAYYETTVPNYRTRLGVVGATNVKGIKWLYSGGGAFSGHYYAQWHVYGMKSSGQTPHRIDFCDHTGAELVLDNDYGDQPRNSERIWNATDTWNQGSALYIKNRSSTKQAQDINISFEVVNGSSDMASWIKLSTNGVTYSGSINYGSANPQEIIGPIYVSHAPDVSAALSLKAGRLRVSVGTWL